MQMPRETWKHKTETSNRTNDLLLIKMFVTLTPVFGIEQDRFNLSSLMHCLNLFSLYKENLKRCKLNPFTSRRYDLHSGLSGQGYP